MATRELLLEQRAPSMRVYEVADEGAVFWYAAEEGAQALGTHWSRLGTGPDDMTSNEAYAVIVRRLRDNDVVRARYDSILEVPRHLRQHAQRLDGEAFAVQLHAREWATVYAMLNRAEGMEGRAHLLGGTL
jgi:hypothetical protein